MNRYTHLIIKTKRIYPPTRGDRVKPDMTMLNTIALDYIQPTFRGLVLEHDDKGLHVLWDGERTTTFWPQCWLLHE